MSFPFQDMNQERRNHLLAFALWTALAIWLVWIFASAVIQGWGFDMREFWSAARTFQTGNNPYVQILQSPQTSELPPGNQFKHLPWVILIFAPLAHFDFSIAIRIWAAINWILIICSMILLVHLLHEKTPSWGLPLVCLAVILMEVRTLQSAQIDLLVVNGLLLGVFFQKRGWNVCAGLAFSLFLIKPWIAVGALVPLLAAAAFRKNLSVWAGFLAGCSGMIIASVAVWPGWWLSYIQVDFSGAFGNKINGVYQEYWPVSTIFEFTRFILGWQQHPWLVAAQILFLIVLTTTLSVSVWQAWRAHRVNDLFLAGAGSLLGLLVIPYIRYVNYPILVFWWIGVATPLLCGPELSRAGKWAVLACIIIAMSFPLGYHLEPWMYQLPLMLYMATAFGVLLLRKSSPKGVKRPTSG